MESIFATPKNLLTTPNLRNAGLDCLIWALNVLLKIGEYGTTQLLLMLMSALLVYFVNDCLPLSVSEEFDSKHSDTRFICIYYICINIKNWTSQQLEHIWKTAETGETDFSVPLESSRHEKKHIVSDLENCCIKLCISIFYRLKSVYSKPSTIIPIINYQQNCYHNNSSPQLRIAV